MSRIFKIDVNSHCKNYEYSTPINKKRNSNLHLIYT